MERSKYISLVTELRQIAVARALVLLNDKEDAEDVAAEVMLRLWERHRLLRDDTDEVRHFADTCDYSTGRIVKTKIHAVSQTFQTRIRLSSTLRTKRLATSSERQ